LTKDKSGGKLMGGRIQERRIRKRGLDLEKGERILFGGRRRNQEEEKGCNIYLGFFY